MITIVSGLPRSGTSLAMQMLAAGGIPVLADDTRPADENNPRGYHEFERVRRLGAGDGSWLAQAEGRAVKIVWPMLVSIPANWHIRVIWMNRAIDEIMDSQARMLARGGQKTEEAVVLQRAFAAMREQARLWLAARPNTTAIFVDYATLLTARQTEAARLAAWLDGNLDVPAMVAAVDPALWRERRRG